VICKSRDTNYYRKLAKDHEHGLIFSSLKLTLIKENGKVRELKKESDEVKLKN